MRLVVELENPKEASFIKRILEQVKGVKSVIETDNQPMTDEQFGEELQRMSNNIVAEDCIPYEQVKKNLKAKLCELSSQKKLTNR